jgi:hypothetical protein
MCICYFIIQSDKIVVAFNREESVWREAGSLRMEGPKIAYSKDLMRGTTWFGIAGDKVAFLTDYAEDLNEIYESL